MGLLQFRRPDEVVRRCTKANTRSRVRPSATVKTVPTKTASTLPGSPSRVRPPWMNEPSPSPPTSTARAPGQTVHKLIYPGGRKFECEVDHFDAERDRFPYPDNHFEMVTVCELIEHLL